MKWFSRCWLLVFSASLAAQSTDAFWDLIFPEKLLNNPISVLINTDVAVNGTPIFGNVLTKFHLSTTRNDDHPTGTLQGSSLELGKRDANTTEVGGRDKDQRNETSSHNGAVAGDDDSTSDKSAVKRLDNQPQGSSTSQKSPDLPATTSTTIQRGGPPKTTTTTARPKPEGRRGLPTTVTPGPYVDNHIPTTGPRDDDAPCTLATNRRVPMTGPQAVYERMVNDMDYRVINDAGLAPNCLYCAAAAFRGCTVSALMSAYGLSPAATVLDAETVDRLLDVFRLAVCSGATREWYRDYMSLWHELNERTGPGQTGTYALAYNDAHHVGHVVTLRVRKECSWYAPMHVLAVDYEKPVVSGDQLSGRFNHALPFGDQYYLFVLDARPRDRESAGVAREPPNDRGDSDERRSTGTHHPRNDVAQPADWYLYKPSSSSSSSSYPRPY